MTTLAIKQSVSSITYHVKTDFKRWLFTKHFFLMLAMVLYLLFESSFHAILTMVVIDPTSTIDDIHRVEIYGRLISGFGSGLLFTGFFLKRLPSRRRNKFTQSIIFCAIFCVVYFGQKALIERVLIEPSSPEVRRDALLVNTVKKGLYNADVVSRGLPISTELREDIEPKVMVSLVSSAFLYNDKFKDATLRKIKPILTAIATNSYDEVFINEIAPKYKEGKAEIKDAFIDYQNAHYRLNDKLERSNLEREWEKIFDKAAEKYVREDIRQQARDSGYLIETRRERREYEKRVSKSLNQLKKYKISKGKTKLTAGSAKRFISQSQNRYSDVNKEIQKEMSLPKNSFQLYPRTKAYPWIGHHIVEEFEKELAKQLSREGIHNMATHIGDFKVFERHKDIKAKAKDMFGDYRVYNFSFNMSNSQLHRAMKYSFIKVETERMYKDIKSNVSKFEDGGELAEVGKNALRALLIPCIALILSVLLSISSIVKLTVIALDSFYNSAMKGSGLLSKVFFNKYSCKNAREWRKREFMFLCYKLSKALIVIAVLYVVANAPAYIGWYEEVKPLLSQNSLIRTNIEPGLELVVDMYSRVIIYIFLLGLPVYFIRNVWKIEKRLISREKHFFSNIGIKFKRFWLYGYALLKLMFSGILLITLLWFSYQKENGTSKHSIYMYEWLLSVQPMVFHQGMILNDQLSLPNMVDTITPSLKSIDDHFWPTSH